MKRRLWIIALVCFCTAGCKGKKQEEERQDKDLARQVFVTETNSVEVIVLREQDFHKQIISNGKVEAWQRAVLSFQTTGKLSSVKVSDGRHVHKGDTLATLDIEDARHQYDRAVLAYRKAELDLRDRLLDFGYGPETDTTAIPRETMQIVYLRSGFTDAKHSLESSKMALERCVLTAPFTGKAADVKLKAHEQSSGNFCTLIDDAVLNVKFSVLETEIGFVRMGQPVKVYSFNDPENIITGRVTGINPTVDINGQIHVTAQIQNNGLMIDGMNVRVLVENVVPRQLVVPKSAVVIRDNLEVLFRVVNGRSVWTYVHTTAANSKQYVVTANTERGAELNPGDTIIISGNLNLGGNTSVEIITD